MTRVLHYLVLCPLGGLLFIGISFTNKGFVYPSPIEEFYIPFSVGVVVGFLVASYLNMIHRNHKETQAFFQEMVESLAMALDERDEYTHGHSLRVTELSLALGKRIGLSKAELKVLSLAGTLHDIGKIGVPDDILLKKGHLNADEYSIIQQHPVQAEHILKMIKGPLMANIMVVVRHHHERYDGAGYPDGLIGGDIPLLSRIIAVADTYDAMTSTRPYRTALSIPVALDEIEINSGIQFDGALSEVFVKMMKGQKS